MRGSLASSFWSKVQPVWCTRACMLMILVDLWTISNIYTCFQVTLSASICMSHASSEMWCWGYSLSLPQRRSILCSSSGPQPQSFCPTFSGSIRGAKEGNVRGLGHDWPGKFGFRGPSNTWKCTQDCIHNNQRVQTMKFIVFITKKYFILILV